MTYLTRIQRERQAELLNQIYLTKYFKSNTLLRLEIFIYKADKCYIHHTINPCTYENFPSTLTLFLLPNHVHICSPFILFTITIEGSPSTHHWRQIPLKLRLKPLHDFDRVFESIPRVCRTYGNVENSKNYEAQGMEDKLHFCDKNIEKSNPPILTFKKL